MASSGKKKTTMAKLARESRLRERRAHKQAKKDARKLAPLDDSNSLGEAPDVATGELAGPDVGEPTLETVVQAVSDPDPT
jgi:hypothetical protein